MPSLAVALLLLAVPLLQDEEPDWKRYQKELQPKQDIEDRLETVKNVVFYESDKALDLLLDTLKDSLVRLEDLEKERLKNDEKIRKTLGPQVLSGPDVNYAGLEEYQARQKELGHQITAEERMVRGLRDALAGIKDRDLWQKLAKYKAKKPVRMRLVLIDVFGHIKDPLVTEILVELLNERDTALVIAAAEALSHHDREYVPVPAYGALLNSEAWPVRAVAIDALGRLGGSEAVDLLVHHTMHERGRQLSELVTRLELLTGQKFGKTPRAWLDWWDKNKGLYKDGPVVLTRPVTVKGDGRMEYWGIRVDSLRVIFVIDISGTMAAALDDYEDLDPEPGKSRLDLARRQLKAAMTALPSDATFNMIAYSDAVLHWKEKMQPATKGVKDKAFEWLDKLNAVGATNIFDALETAFQLSTPGTRDKYYDTIGDTILFLSDGGPTAGRTTDCDEILAQVREWNKVKKITIHSFGIGKQLNRKFMQDLAVQNGGECRFID